MAIAVVGVGTQQNSASFITPPYPGGYTAIANHIALTFVESGSADTVTPPTNWVTLGSVNVTTGSFPTKLSVLWRRLTASEAAPTIADAGDHMVGQMMVVSGCVTSGNPWEALSQTTELTADTSVSIPGGTTTVNGALWIAVFGTGQDVASTNGVNATWANASLTNLTERMDIWTSTGGGGGFAMVTGEKATAGAVSATTATLTLTANFKTLISFALKPEPAAVIPSLVIPSRWY